MARIGYFGSLPAEAQNLSGAIVSAIESYESRRDQLIYNAWLEGGTFEGKKVTDQRLLKWYKTRRDQYSRDDPTWEMWNQAIQQRSYDIDEDKMLTRHAQGDVSDGDMANWYRREGNQRFATNSAAWRTAMQQSAMYQKKTQESNVAAREEARRKRYEHIQQGVYKRDIKPMERAREIFADALERRYNVRDINQLGEDFRPGNEEMEAFLESKDGERFAKRWQRLTGDKFDLAQYRRILRNGASGYRQWTRNARRFKYAPESTWATAQVTLEAEAGRIETFRNDLADQQQDAFDDYRENMATATTDDERIKYRNALAARLLPLERAAAKGGDDPYAAEVLKLRLAYMGKGEGTGTDVGNVVTTINPQTGVETVDMQAYGGSNAEPSLEYIRAESQLAIQKAEGLRKGTHVYVQTIDEASQLPRLDIIKADFFGPNGPDVREWASGDIGLTGLVGVDGLGAGQTTVNIKKEPLTFVVAGQGEAAQQQIPQTPGNSWEDGGQAYYEYLNPVTKQMMVTLIPPLELTGGAMGDRGSIEDYIVSSKSVGGQRVITLNPSLFTPIPTGVIPEGEQTPAQWFQNFLNPAAAALPGTIGSGVTYSRPGENLEGEYKRGADESMADYEARLRGIHQRQLDVNRSMRTTTPSSISEGVAGQFAAEDVPSEDFDTWLRDVQGLTPEGVPKPPPVPEEQEGEAPVSTTGPGAANQSPEASEWLNNPLNFDTVAYLEGKKLVSEEDDFEGKRRFMAGVTAEQVVEALSTQHAELPMSPEEKQAQITRMTPWFAGIRSSGPLPDVQSTLPSEPAAAQEAAAAAGAAAAPDVAPVLQTPAIISGALFSYDTSNRLLRASSSLTNRIAFAKLDEQVVLEEVIKYNHWEDNPEMQYESARFIDMVVSVGPQGESEYQWYLDSPSASTREAMQKGHTRDALRRWQGEREAESQVERLANDPEFVKRLTGDLTESEIALRYPDLLSDEEQAAGAEPNADLAGLFARGKANAEREVATTGVGYDPTTSLTRDITMRGFAAFEGGEGLPGTPPTTPAPRKAGGFESIAGQFTPKVDVPPPYWAIGAGPKPRNGVAGIPPLPSGRPRTAPSLAGWNPMTRWAPPSLTRAIAALRPASTITAPRAFGLPTSAGYRQQTYSASAARQQERFGIMPSPTYDPSRRESYDWEG